MTESTDHTRSNTAQLTHNPQVDRDVVVYQGISMSKEAAMANGWVDQSSNEVGPSGASVPSRDPLEMTADGVTHATVQAAEQEYNALVHHADVGMIKTLENDFFGGNPHAQEWVERNAPNLVAQGEGRAAVWAEKLGVDVDMLRTSLVDEDSKGRMLQAIFRGDENAFRAEIAKTKHALLAEIQGRLHEFHIEGARIEQDGTIVGPDGAEGNLVDLLMSGQIDLEDL